MPIIGNSIRTQVLTLFSTPIRGWVWPLLLREGLLLAENLQIPPLQLRQGQAPLLLQTADGAAGQLWPAVVAQTGLAFYAGCRLPSGHVVCRLLLPVWGLVARWVVVSAFAAQTAAAAWRILLLHLLSPHWAQAVAIGTLQAGKNSIRLKLC
jgi:hypothetical protein